MNTLLQLSYVLILLVFCSNTTLKSQSNRLFEESYTPNITDEEILELYLDTITKYLYGDIELTRKTIQASQELVDSGIQISDSLNCIFHFNKVLFKFAESDVLGAYEEFINNESILKKPSLPKSLIDKVEYIQAFIYMELGDLESAQKRFYANIKNARSTKDTTSIISNLYSLGQLFQSDAEYGDAIKSFTRAISLCNETNILPSTIALLYSELGETYNKIGDYDLALSTLDKGIEYAKSEGLGVIKVDQLIEKGKTYFNSGNLNAAENIYKQIIQSDSKNIDKTIERNLALYKGSIMESQNKNREAINVYLNLVSKTDTSDGNVLLDIYDHLHKLHHKEGDLGAAYKYLNLYEDVNSRLQLDEKRQKTAYLKVKFETAEKEKNNQLLEAQLTQAKTQRSLLFALMGLFGVLLATVFFAYFQKNRYNKLLIKNVEEKTNSLAQSNNQLKETNKELDEFNRILSHDLKEPIRNIISFSQLATNSSTDSTAEQHLNTVTQSGHQLQSLIENVVEYQHINKLDPSQRESIDTNKLIASQINSLQETYPDKQIDIEYSKLPTVNTHKELVSILFQNILENSVKFSTTKPLFIKVAYKLETDNHIFDIIDNGIGISKEYQDQIFEKFKKLNVQSKYLGTGLGLNLARKSAQKLGGDITLVNSKLGKGSTFRITLPTK